MEKSSSMARSAPCSPRQSIPTQGAAGGGAQAIRRRPADAPVVISTRFESLVPDQARRAAQVVAISKGGRHQHGTAQGETLGVVARAARAKPRSAWRFCVDFVRRAVVFMATRSRPQVQADAPYRRHADRVPGPLRLAVAAHVGVRYHRGRPVVHHPNMPAEERESQSCGAQRCRARYHERFRYPHEFSGGQRQRIALARALVLGRPSSCSTSRPARSHVDPVANGRSAARPAEETRSDLYVISHDLRVVAALASRLLVLRNGKMVEEGAASDLFKNPKMATPRAVCAAFNLESARKACGAMNRYWNRIFCAVVLGFCLLAGGAQPRSLATPNTPSRMTTAIRLRISI